MAQLHARNHRIAFANLRQWGALFDRTESGDILHGLSAATTLSASATLATALGLEMIRTLQIAASSRA